MSVYIGYVEKKNNYERGLFFNFTPIARVVSNQLLVLSEEDRTALLPDSEKRNINFKYDWNSENELEEMNAMFGENSLIAFDFSLEDLEDNINSMGDRNPTGYRVQAIEMINNKRIKRIHEVGVYYFVRSKDIISNIENDTVVDINPLHVTDGDHVFVEYKDIWAGPYRVGFRTQNSCFWIRPEVKENKYTLTGYSKGDLTINRLEKPDKSWKSEDNEWEVLVLKSGKQIKQKDVIDDRLLLESFVNCVSNEDTGNNKASLSHIDIPTLLKQYEVSYLSGKDISTDIQKERLSRLEAVLTSESNLDETLNSITNGFCDLLVRYQNSEGVENWLQGLLEQHPELIYELKETKAIATRIDDMKQQLSELQDKRADIDHIITELQAEAQRINTEKDGSDQIVIGEDMQAKIDEAEAIIAANQSLSELQEKQRSVKKDVDYLETHSSHLKDSVASLEGEFSALMSSKRKKMLEISFDSFISNKMLQAAASWDSENAEIQREELTQGLSELPLAEKSPEELVDYLCQIIHKVRPLYGKNTIINLAICLTQSFLTVLSGEPGSGKTSISNIFGKALGLNKVSNMLADKLAADLEANRYVSVSIERGWTSKRDFVGYYNPLTKTFDKSNRKVFDALAQLSYEKKHGFLNIPYVILLDEANLSPMEYYWSDFMNICDDLNNHSEVNLGENYVFGVPETLHFIATINNDFTTEELSPRLIDRAWIVSLPRNNNISVSDLEIPEEEIEIISWQSLSNAFLPNPDDCVFSPDIQKIFDNIIGKMGAKKIIVSPRVQMAIKRYWAIASRLFEADETQTEPAVVALDYAIVQKLLPKIQGQGEGFASFLEDLKTFCSGNSLTMAADKLNDIIERGANNMKYYRFFS